MFVYVHKVGVTVSPRFNGGSYGSWPISVPYSLLVRGLAVVDWTFGGAPIMEAGTEMRRSADYCSPAGKTKNPGSLYKATNPTQTQLSEVAVQSDIRTSK